MKTYIRLIALFLVAVFGLISCAVPEGTPAQKARQTEANARVGNAVALGIAATLLGAAANKYADNTRPRYYYVRPRPRVYYVPPPVYYY